MKFEILLKQGNNIQKIRQNSEHLKISKMQLDFFNFHQFKNLNIEIKAISEHFGSSPIAKYIYKFNEGKND